MKCLLTILLFCSCTTTKTYLLDGSESTGNIVKYEWKINGLQYDNGITTSANIKRVATVELIVTDNKGLKDTAKTTIR